MKIGGSTLWYHNVRSKLFKCRSSLSSLWQYTSHPTQWALVHRSCFCGDYPRSRLVYYIVPDMIHDTSLYAGVYNTAVSYMLQSTTFDLRALEGLIGQQAANTRSPIYTSAKIGALRAPYFFLLGCVKRRSYMLIHV